MQDINLDNHLEFKLKVIGKEDVVDSELKIFRVYGTTVKEEISPSNAKYFKLQDIFNMLLLDAKNSIMLHCEYDTNGNLYIFITSATKKMYIMVPRSRYGSNKFPVRPNKSEIQELKTLVEDIKNKLKYLKEEFEYSYEDSFTL